MTDPRANPLWDFSLAVWAREGVEPAALALQARHGLDLTLLLFCGFAGCRGHALDGDDMRRLIETVRPWRDAAVLPLRGVRTWLKTQSVAPADAAACLRAQIKEDELRAEAIQQMLILRTVPVPEGAGGPQVTAGNMATYLGALGIAPDAADTADLAAVLRGCHPELAPLQAVWLLSN